MTEPDNRFARTELLLGAEACARLRAARVVVAGLGGVGSYAAEALARMGVGQLRIVDFDTVKPSNVNRQLYALESTLGRPKVEVARARILDIDPACEVEAMPVFIDDTTVAGVLSGPPDVVIDAIDSLNPKLTLVSRAVESGVCVISSMGAATRTDPFAVRVADIAETRMCPLARHLRKRLRKRGIGSGVRCVYSVEPDSGRRGVADDDGEAEFARGRPRAPLGSLSYMTGIFGLVAAREAVLSILGPALGTGNAGAGVPPEDGAVSA
ncbi:MAG: tRNA threonylcarbamoyladenosine dehydratase [Kiritimatiellae bacterium]|nr:tRNA threonylcarbamoyladenosine dehydratase [Kiritimatiellia bacterium]